MQQKILLGVIGMLLIGAGVFGYMQFTPQESNVTPIEETPVAEGLSNETETIPNQTDPTPPEGNTGAIPTTYTLAEISTHNNASDCYAAINGSVYNLTSFVGNHPGGQAILKICGTDGSAVFSAQHGGGPQQAAILATLKIGTLAR